MLLLPVSPSKMSPIKMHFQSLMEVDAREERSPVPEHAGGRFHTFWTNKKKHHDCLFVLWRMQLVISLSMGV